VALSKENQRSCNVRGNNFVLQQVGAGQSSDGEKTVYINEQDHHDHPNLPLLQCYLQSRFNHLAYVTVYLYICIKLNCDDLLLLFYSCLFINYLFNCYFYFGHCHSSVNVHLDFNE
jgi:hypothetical protein